MRNANSVKEQDNNMTASIIRAIGGLTVVVGILSGLAYSSIIVGAYGFFAGVFFMGLSEAIRILHEMNERQKKKDSA
jgi:hypothetical protein